MTVHQFPPMSKDEIIAGIQAALETDETGTDLIEVARDAKRAEQKLAWLINHLTQDY